MHLSWVQPGCIETSVIWNTPSVTQLEIPCALHCLPALANVATAFQLLGDTHAEVSYSCSCQLIEATQGNRKPCEEWTHRGGAEIFYKARRNVPGGNGNKEEERDKVASCWYGYVYLKLQLIHLFDDDSVLKILVWSIQNTYHHNLRFVLYLIVLAILQDCVPA